MTTITVPRAVLEQVLEALVTAEAGLADIGDADREQGDDVAWCEARATAALEGPRAAITALRAALAQQVVDPADEYRKGFIDGQIDMRDRPEEQEQEPVAWRSQNATPPGGFVIFQQYPQALADLGGVIEPLYTAPPRREWKGLKEWEINDGRDQLPTEDLCNWSFRQGVYFAEAKLKEKNQ
jgi:hypothetical protein